MTSCIYIYRLVVDAVSRLAFESVDTSPRLRQSALLTLGGMANHLRSKQGNLSSSIVQSLHSALDHYSSTESQRLRRSPDGLANPSLHAVLLDSIGNARALQSQSILIDHMNSNHGNLAAKHAAVKALQSYDTEEVCGI